MDESKELKGCGLAHYEPISAHGQAIVTGRENHSKRRSTFATSLILETLGGLLLYINGLLCGCSLYCCHAERSDCDIRRGCMRGMADLGLEHLCAMPCDMGCIPRPPAHEEICMGWECAINGRGVAFGQPRKKVCEMDGRVKSRTKRRRTLRIACSYSFWPADARSLRALRPLSRPRFVRTTGSAGVFLVEITRLEDRYSLGIVWAHGGDCRRSGYAVSHKSHKASFGGMFQEMWLKGTVCPPLISVSDQLGKSSN